MSQTTHNQSRQWHRNGIKKLQSQTQISKGADPKFPTNTSFDKKHKKGLKKMQADRAKAMNAHAEAIKALIKTKEVKTNSSKGSSYKLSQLAYIAYPKIGKCVCAGLPRVSGIAKGQGQGSNQAPGCGWHCSPSSSSSSGFQRCPGPCKSSTIEASVCGYEDGRTRVTPGLLSAGGWCPSVLLVQINLRQELPKKKCHKFKK